MSVNEFQVVTSGGQAEFGRALGGYINVVTKSGTNALHGDLYGYFRNQRLNAANALSDAKLPLTQAQYGASLGGPVGSRPHVLLCQFRAARAEPVADSSPSIPRTSPRSTPGWRRSATRVRAISTGLYPNPVHNSNFLAKVDHQFSEGDQFSVRYSLYDVHSPNSRGAGALNAATRRGRAWTTPIRPSPRATSLTLSPRVVNETRGQFTRSNLARSPERSGGPAVSIAGVASFGTLSGSPTGAREQSVRDGGQPFLPERRARPPRGPGLPVQRRHASRIRGRSAAATRFLPWPTSSAALTTTRDSRRLSATP